MIDPRAVLASGFAALIVAFAGQMLISSLSSMSDEPALFWATLSALALIRYHNKKAKRWLALAAYALGWAVMTRWVFALLIPVWVAAILVDHFKRENTHVACSCRVFRARHVSSDRADGTRGKPGGSFTFGGFADIRLEPFKRAGHNVVNPDGHFVYPWPIAIYYAQPLVHPSYLFPLFALLTLGGAWSLRRQPFWLVLTVGWIGANWVFLAGVTWQNWRFPLAFFPPIAVLTGVGLNAALRHMAEKEQDCCRNCERRLDHHSCVGRSRCRCLYGASSRRPGDGRLGPDARCRRTQRSLHSRLLTHWHTLRP